MPEVRKLKTCVVCGGPLTIEDGSVCVACGLIAFYAGDDPRVVAAQEEVWRAILDAAGN